MLIWQSFFRDLKPLKPFHFLKELKQKRILKTFLLKVAKLA